MEKVGLPGRQQDDPIQLWAHSWEGLHIFFS